MAEPAPNSTLLQQLAAQYQTPQTIPAVQHSQYLAQALANLQESSKNNIRNPTALWSNLLADGLLQYARHKSDAQLMGAVQSGQQSQQSTADNLMGLSTSAPPQALAQPQAASGIGGMLAHILGHGAPPPAPAMPQLPAVSAPPPSASISSAPAAQMSAPPPSAPDASAAPPMAQLPPLPAAPSAPVGIPGLPTPAQVAGDFPGAALTSGLRTPAHNAEVGGVPNSWHLMGTSDAPDALDLVPPHGMSMLQFASAVQGQYPQARIINEGTHLHVQPNMSNTGAQPQSLTAPPLGSGGAPPAAAPPPAAGGMPPSAATQPPPVQGIPTGAGPTPQEIALYQQYMANPLTRQLGLEMAQKIAARRAAPIELNKDEYFTPDGQAHSVHQMQDVRSTAPNSYVQRDPVTGELKISANPAYGPVGAGQVMGPGGQISQVPTTQRQTFRIPGSPGVYVSGPDGSPQKVADDNYTVKDASAALQELTASPQYEKAVKLTEMLRGAAAAASRPGGITDAELKDNAAQIFSGGVARQFNSKMIDEGQGPLLRLKQFAGEIMSGQKLSPEARQAILRAMTDYTSEAQTAFNGLAKSKTDFAASHGQDLSPFLGSLLQKIPQIPDIASIPTGSGGYDTGAHAAATPPGWPVINGKPLDQNSPAGKMAQQFLARGLHYDPKTGGWQ